MNAVNEIASFLDEELNLAAFEDASNNGLQVANSGRVERVCAGVDASMDFFERAAEVGADLLICHHGLSWGDSLKHITGLNYNRIKYLLDHDMALYACHLPLDAHPRLGNNALICQGLGLTNLSPFGLYHGASIGFAGSLPEPMPFSELKSRARALFGRLSDTMEFGREEVRTVAVVSGGAAAEIDEAGRKGLDVYVTGEPVLMAYHLAREYGLHAIYAGHYASEVFGVRAVGDLLATRFDLQASFLDMAVRF